MKQFKLGDMVRQRFYGKNFGSKGIVVNTNYNNTEYKLLVIFSNGHSKFFTKIGNSFAARAPRRDDLVHDYE